MRYPGMRRIYKHIAPEWRADLVSGLQRIWEESLTERAAIAPRSAVPLLDRLLAAHRKPARARVRFNSAPKIGH